MEIREFELSAMYSAQDFGGADSSRDSRKPCIQKAHYTVAVYRQTVRKIRFTTGTDPQFSAHSGLTGEQY